MTNNTDTTRYTEKEIAEITGKPVIRFIFDSGKGTLNPYGISTIEEIKSHIVENAKEGVSLENVLKYVRSQGPGIQGKVNQTLIDNGYKIALPEKNSLGARIYNQFQDKTKEVSLWKESKPKKNDYSEIAKRVLGEDSKSLKRGEIRRPYEGKQFYSGERK